MKMKITSMCLVLLVSTSVFAGDIQLLEKKLVKSIRKINHWKTHFFSFYEKDEIYDSLYYENALFKGMLLDYTVSEPNTISHPFDSLRKYIDIASSEDNKFRIYSWYIGNDEEDMGFFINIYQYESEGKIYNTMINYDDMYDPKGYYSTIHSVDIGEDSTVYMGYFHAFYSPFDFSESLQTFMIKDGVLNDSIDVFIKNDTLMNSIEVLYNPLSQKKHMKQLIQYNLDKKIVKIRQTDNNGVLLRKFKKLTFNGKQFEYAEE